MKKITIKSWLLALIAGMLAVMPACKLDDIENPNAPTIESLEDGGASLNDLRLLTAGLESVLRVDMELHYWTVNVVGRELWDLRQVDPRYTGELLGKGGSPLDPNGFLTTRAYATHYRAARNAWILIHAADNNQASLTTGQANGFKGYARTILAYALLLELNRQYENGIRTDVEDRDNLGPFRSYNEALRDIAAYLTQAYTELNGADTEFLFSNTLGGLTKFKQFNRAIAARVAMYEGSKGEMRNHLADTWLDLDGDMNEGVYHVFGLGGNNVPNPMYTVAGETQYIAHPQTVAQADTIQVISGSDTAVVTDSRLTSRTTKLDAALDSDGLSGDVQVTLVPSNTSPFPIIRNEELILMWAEANIGFDNAETVRAINKVRAAAGMRDYNGPTDDASLTNQLLHERRYSLFGEGHRWIDMRRFDRLSELPIDRAGDVVHRQFPRPVLEQ